MPATQRLSALDAAFVTLDAHGAPFLVGAVLTFERRPLLVDGRLDAARLREYVSAALDRVPRYRQRIDRVPLLRHPVWVDDERWDLDRHLRFDALPAPGGRAALAEYAGRVFSEDLPLDHPPWMLWVIDDAASDRVALVAKVHHSLVDGVAGVRLLERLLRDSPDAEVPARLPWTPERARPLWLLRDELAYRARGIVALARRRVDHPWRLARTFASLLARGLHPASDAGLNPPRVGRRRALAMLDVPLAGATTARQRTGATLNEVVLGACAGGLRRFLARRGVDVSSLTDLRAMVPVSTHARGEASVSGNRVALLLVPLPVDEPDPDRRIARVHTATGDRDRRAREAEAGDFLVALADVTVPALLPSVLGMSTARRGFAIVITNVPGPTTGLYLLGARLLGFYPIVNLWPRQTIGIAVLSYGGVLHLSIHADREAAPDVELLVDDLRAAFTELGPAQVVPPPASWSMPAARA